MSLSAPFRGGVLAVEWVLELNNMAVPLTQEILLFSVILHQLGKRSKLLAAVQVVVVTRVLDLNVGHLIVPSEQEKPQWEFNRLVSHHATTEMDTLKKCSAALLTCTLNTHRNNHPHILYVHTVNADTNKIKNLHTLSPTSLSLKACTL